MRCLCGWYSFCWVDLKLIHIHTRTSHKDWQIVMANHTTHTSGISSQENWHTVETHTNQPLVALLGGQCCWRTILGIRQRTTNRPTIDQPTADRAREFGVQALHVALEAWTLTMWGYSLKVQLWPLWPVSHSESSELSSFTLSEGDIQDM